MRGSETEVALIAYLIGIFAHKETDEIQRRFGFELAEALAILREGGGWIN